MNISLTIDAEALASIDRRLAENQTREQFCAALVMAEVARFVATDFDAAVLRVAELVKPKSYEERVAIIAQLEGGTP
jgi:hypothetical protein